VSPGNRRSIWAVVAGVLFIIVVTTLVDIVLHATGVYPPMNQPINDALAVLATSIASSSASAAPGSQPGSRRKGP